jgi:hypothetical protein
VPSTKEFFCQPNYTVQLGGCVDQKVWRSIDNHCWIAPSFGINYPHGVPNMLYCLFKPLREGSESMSLGGAFSPTPRCPWARIPPESGLSVLSGSHVWVSIGVQLSGRDARNLRLAGGHRLQTTEAHGILGTPCIILSRGPAHGSAVGMVELPIVVTLDSSFRGVPNLRKTAGDAMP